jgi:predicted ATPase
VDFSAAEDAFQAALYEARSQKARSLELRAALSLARLYCASGREQLVPQLVEPVVARFKEEPQLYTDLEMGDRVACRGGTLNR